MYVVKVVIQRFSLYTYFKNSLFICYLWFYNNMASLNLIFNKKEIILDTWFNQRLVFEIKIAVWQKTCF